MNSTVLEFYKPFLHYIDSGDFFRTPFGWLYAVLAVFNLLIPLVILYVAIDNQLFSMGAAFFFAFLILWIVIAGASWIGFQIWWNRRQVLAAQTSPDPDFVATPVYTHFLQTCGEWCGSWVAIVGAGAGLVSGIFLRNEGLDFLLPIPLVSTGGFLSVLLMPVLGFLIIIVTRVIAEQIRALVAVAINTKG